MMRPTPSIRIRTLSWVATLIVAGMGTACERPCERLEERLEACTRAAPQRALHDAPGVKDAIRTRCRRAEPSRVKRCLQLQDCRQILQCAETALKPPTHRF